MKDKKGFTLIELLAVIAIISILAVIALPNVIKTYKRSKKQVFLTEAQTIASTSTKQYLTNDIQEYLDGTSYCKSRTNENKPLDLSGGKKYYYVKVDADGETKKLIIWDNKQYIKYISDGTREISDLKIEEIVEQNNYDMNCDNVLEKTNSIIKPDKTYVLNYHVDGNTHTNEITATAIIPESSTSNFNKVKYIIYRKITRNPNGSAETEYKKIDEVTLTNKSENFSYTYNDNFASTVCLFADYKIEAYTEDDYKISESSGEYSYCFVAGTKVKTETGYKNIEDIKVGEKVYSYNLDNNELELKKVLGTIVSSTKDTYTLTIANKKVEMSPKHQIYIVDKGWTRAYDVKKGDKMLTSDNKVVEIENIEYKVYDKPIKTYNLTIEGNSNYYVTDIQVLVHNAGSVYCGK